MLRARARSGRRALVVSGTIAALILGTGAAGTAAAAEESAATAVTTATGPTSSSAAARSTRRDPTVDRKIAETSIRQLQQGNLDEPVVDGTMAPAPALSMGVTQTAPARVRGEGLVEVGLVRSASGAPLRGVRVVIPAPKGGDVSRAAGEGWRCSTKSGRAECRLRSGSLARDLTPMPITAAVRVKRSVRSGTPMAVRAMATWRGGGTTVTRRDPWQVRDTTRILAQPALRLTSLSSVQGKQVGLLTGDTGQRRQFGLMATVANIGGAAVTARWRQLSGPKVTFVRPTRVNHAQARMSQVVEVRDHPRKADGRYRFRLAVSDAGQTVRRDVTVNVDAQDMVTDASPRNGRLRQLARSTRIDDLTRTGGSRQTKVPVSKIHVRGPRWSTDGKPVRFVTEVRSGRVRSVSWSVSSSPGVAGTGRTLRIPAPAIGSSEVVTARAIMADGTVQIDAHVVTSHRATTVPTVRQRSVTAQALEPRIKEQFCDVVGQRLEDGKISAGNGFEFTWKARVMKLDPEDAKECTGDEKLTFTRARGVTISFNGVDILTEMTGTITSAGLRIEKGVWLVPERLTQKLPKKLKLTELDLETGKTTPSIPLTVDGWGELTGDLSKKNDKKTKVAKWVVNQLLPADWEASLSALSFLPLATETTTNSPGSLQISQTINDTSAERCQDPDPTKELPECGSAQVSLRLVGNQGSQLSLAVAGINLGKTAGGNSITAGGEVTLDLDKPGFTATLKVNCGADPAAGCELVKNLRLTRAELTLRVGSDSRLGFAATASVPGRDPATPYVFTVDGVYRGPDNWSIEAKNANPWPLADGVVLDDVAGRIERRVDPGLETKAQLLVALRAKVSTFPVSSSIKEFTAGAEIGNTCLSDSDSSSEPCNAGELRASFKASITAALPGGSTPTIGMLGRYNFTTGKYLFAGDVDGVSIGPEQFQVRSAGFSFSNDASSAVCRAGNTPPPTAEGTFTLGLTASGRVMGQSVAALGTFSSGGYCLAAQTGENTDLGNGMATSANLVAYTSYRDGATIQIPGRDPAYVLSGQVVLAGQFEIPKSVTEFLGAPQGKVTYTATGSLDWSTLDFAISYEINKPVPVYAKKDATGRTLSSLSLAKVGLTARWTKDPFQAALSFGATGDLFVAGTAGSTPDSTTPLSVWGAFEFGRGGVKVSLGAGVETEGGKKPVTNAFGVQDLTVRDLTLVAGFAIGEAGLTPALEFNADVTLPGSWGPGAGIKDGIPIKLAFKFGDTDPCLQFKAGTEPTLTDAGVTSGPVILDVANKGWLTASYFNLTLAPKGCTLKSGLGGTTTIPAGWGFGFDGSIAGSPIKVGLSLGHENNGTQIKGFLNAKLDWKVVTLTNSAGDGPADVWVDVDTSRSKYVMRFDAYLAVGYPKYFGAFINVKGDVNTEGDYNRINVKGNGGLAVGPIGGTIDLDLDVNLAKSDAKDPDAAKNSYARGKAAVEFRALGSTFRARGNLNYEGDQMVELRISAQASVNLLVAALDGTVTFNLCLGTLTPVKADGTGSQCQPYAKDRRKDAKPAYRLDLTGSYRILWWSKDYAWTIYNAEGTAGTTPDAEDPGNSVNLAGDIPLTSPVSLNLESRPGQSERDLHGPAVPLGTAPEGLPKHGWKVVGGRDFKYKDNQGEQVAKACQTITLGNQKWDPVPSSNPALTNPVPTAADPVDTNAYCGMVIDTTWRASSPADTGTTNRYKAVCIAAGCFLPQQEGVATDTYIGGRVNTQQSVTARTALLTGLRTPAGAIPAGTAVDTPVWSPDRNLVLLPFTSGSGRVEVWQCKDAGSAACLTLSKQISQKPNEPYGGVFTEFRSRFDKRFTLQSTSKAGCASDERGWQINRKGQIVETCRGAEVGSVPSLGVGGGGYKKPIDQPGSRRPADSQYPVVLSLLKDSVAIREGKPFADQKILWPSS